MASLRRPDVHRDTALGRVLRTEHVPRAVLDPAPNASRGLAGVALTCFLAGLVGTLLGGRIADRIGMVRTIQLGTAVILPPSEACCSRRGASRRSRSRWRPVSR